ncbi:hypothetical protein [Paenibacillus sp. An7]|uniref:hypothetical protein n=1 Tax=Paenibacillus sp. An7 TaxID=2689577 RepID=UPI00135A13F8|nr:hypothetical protein [Paenibacillus sp. An7]
MSIAYSLITKVENLMYEEYTSLKMFEDDKELYIKHSSALEAYSGVFLLIKEMGLSAHENSLNEEVDITKICELKEKIQKLIKRESLLMDHFMKDKELHIEHQSAYNAYKKIIDFIVDGQEHNPI